MLRARRILRDMLRTDQCVASSGIVFSVRYSSPGLAVFECGD